jgi:hypothetical protein
VITPNVCGNRTPEPANGEDCDNGGTCVGGANAGTACVTETQCIGNGVCDVGTKYGTRCASSADCGGAACVHCKPFGGGGCAANCTTEKTIAVTLKPGETVNTGCPNGASACCKANTSCAQLDAGLDLPLLLTGGETMVVGKKGSNNLVPFVVLASSFHIPAIPVSTLACACVRGMAARSCGGYLFETDGTPSVDCTLDDTCAAQGKPPCTYVNGPGNMAAGVVACTTAGFTPVDVATTQDAGGVAMPPPPTPVPSQTPPIVTLSGSSTTSGSAVEINSIRLGQVAAVCQPPGADPAIYGADGKFCTDDDPDTLLSRGPVSTVMAVTRNATATLFNAGSPGHTIGPYSTAGHVFNCTNLLKASPTASGSGMASAFTLIAGGVPGSGTVTDVLVAQ